MKAQNVFLHILDDSIESPTLILTADHSTLLFLPSFFLQIKNFFFLLWVNLYIITDTYLHDPPPFNGPFFMTPPFSTVSKSCDPPSLSTPPANFWQVPYFQILGSTLYSIRNSTTEMLCPTAFCQYFLSIIFNILFAASLPSKRGHSFRIESSDKTSSLCNDYWHGQSVSRNWGRIVLHWTHERK